MFSLKYMNQIGHSVELSTSYNCNCPLARLLYHAVTFFFFFSDMHH